MNAAQVSHGEVFVRTNPVHDGIRDEIEVFLSTGGNVLMLPNFTSIDEIDSLVRFIDERARVVLLVERLDAINLFQDMPAPGIKEFHVGLNDLSIALGLPNRMELLARPEMVRTAAAAQF